MLLLGSWRVGLWETDVDTWGYSNGELVFEPYSTPGTQFSWYLRYIFNNSGSGWVGLWETDVDTWAIIMVSWSLNHILHLGLNLVGIWETDSIILVPGELVFEKQMLTPWGYYGELVLEQQMLHLGHNSVGFWKTNVALGPGWAGLWETDADTWA
jgi:hypothetical protein